MAIVYGANYGRPTLDLNFAKNKSLIDTVSGLNLITFSRSSTGTYVGADGLIKTAVANEPRFDHNPATGESLGLLVEEARTNLLTYSQEADNGVWGKFEVTVTANATTAPDNTTTADSVVETTNATQHRFDTPLTSVTSGTTYTFSIFLKPNGRNVATLQTKQIGTSGEANGIYTLTGDGSVSGLASGGSGTISKLPNGWYRCTLTATASASGTGNGRVFLETNATVGGVGVFVWGAQVETGSFPTSYIPTTGSTVTRAADVASIQGSNFTNWFNASAGTFLCEWKSISPTNERILHFGTGTISTIISNQGVIGSGTFFSPLQITPNSISQNGIKVAATTSISESAGVYNGNAVVSTGACSYYASASSLNLCPVSTGVRVNWYKRITYWPSRLQDFQLQQLTK